MELQAAQAVVELMAAVGLVQVVLLAAAIRLQVALEQLVVLIF
jgi:hypothetical protein